MPIGENFSQGLNVGSTIRQRPITAGIQKQQADTQRLNVILTDYRTRVGDAVKQASEMMKAAKDTGDPKVIADTERVVDGMAASFARLDPNMSQLAGFQFNSAPLFQAAKQQPTPQQLGAGEARGAVSQRDALVQAGVDPAGAAAAADLAPKSDIVRLENEVAALKPQIAAATGPEKQALQERHDRIENILVKKGTVVGRTPEDVALTKKAKSEAIETQVSAAGAKTKIVNLMGTVKDSVKKGKDLTGLGAEATLRARESKLGQLTDMLFGLDLAEMSQTLLDTASPEEIRAFQTEAQTLVAQSVPVFTAEESGRITKEELAISDRALAIKINTPEQAIAALQEAYKFQILRNERAKAKTGTHKFELISGDKKSQIDAAEKLIDELRADGMADEHIKEIFNMMRRQQQQLKELSDQGLLDGN